MNAVACRDPTEQSHDGWAGTTRRNYLAGSKRGMSASRISALRLLREVKEVRFNTWLKLPTFISSPVVMLSDCPRVYERTKQYKTTSNIYPEAYMDEQKGSKARKGPRTGDQRI